MPQPESPQPNAPTNSPQPKRNAKQGIARQLVGVAMMLAGLGLVALLRYGSAVGIQRPSDVLTIALIVGGLLCAWFGIRLAVQGLKMRTMDADTAIKQSPKAPILYLRSFALDVSDAQHKMPIWGGLSVPINPWESSISQGLSGAGPMVAIGRPGEKFATLGASRIYVSDDEWQAKVLELAEQASLIIWVYGDSEGLRWEISQLTASLPPEKLIIALPIWQLPIKDRPAYWDNLVTQIGHSFPNGLPEQIGQSLFVSFDADWNPHVIEAQPPSLWLRIGLLGGWNRMVWGMRTLLDQRDMPRYQPGKGAIALSLFGGVIWLSLFSLIGILGYGLLQAFT